MSSFRRRGLVAGRSIRTALSLGCVALALMFSACVDESHDLQVQALGGESPAVPRGPLHRSGQPCLVCHGGLGPASAQFVMGGTVYAIKGQPAPAVGAQVTVEDVNGASFTANTNEAGNFYINVAEWSPAFPAQARVQQGQSAQQMITHIGRDGSCAACHTEPPSPISPGGVYVAAGPADGGP